VLIVFVLNNFYMYRIIFLLLITSASFGQVLQETNGSRADNRNVFKLGFRLPQVCWVTGNPNLLNYSAFMSKGAMVYDTCAGKIKRWSGSAWISIQDSTSGGGGSTEYVVSGLGIKVDSSGRAYTVNSDTANASVLSRQRAANTYALIGASPTGSGASPQVAYWSGASTLTGSANYTYNDTYKVIGLGGVTTSNWSYTGASPAASGTIEAGASALLLIGSGFYALNNAYFDGAWKRKAIGLSSNVYIDGGIFSIRNAATGAANSAITWSDRLYMTTDGRFGMNTTTTTAAHFTITPASAVDGIRVNTTGSVSGINIQGTTVAQALIQASTNTGQSAITVANDQPFATALGVFSIYGSNFSTANLRNQVSFGSIQGLLFQSNTTSASGGTSPLEFYTGGGTDVARFARMKSLAMSMNSAGSAADPAASAILDMTSTTKGVLPPRQTTAQRNAIASPAAGLSVYNSSLATNDVYTTAWYQQPNGLTGSGTLDFPSTGAHSSSDLTITVTGAADGDIVILGVPNASVTNESNYSAWVSAANTVTVRYNHYGSGTNNPASGLFKVYVIKN
jgi:hypothetical protein